MSLKEYDLLHPVFRVYDPHDRQMICYVDYVRRYPPVTKKMVIKRRQSKLEQRYQLVKFMFWANGGLNVNTPDDVRP